MYIIEILDYLDLTEYRDDFHNISYEEAVILCQKLAIPQEKSAYILENWAKWKHIPPPSLKSVFQISGMLHLYDEFIETVKTESDAEAFIEKHKLKPHQIDNIRNHWQDGNTSVVFID